MNSFPIELSQKLKIEGFGCTPSGVTETITFASGLSVPKQNFSFDPDRISGRIMDMSESDLSDLMDFYDANKHLSFMFYNEQDGYWYEVQFARSIEPETQNEDNKNLWTVEIPLIQVGDYRRIVWETGLDSDLLDWTPKDKSSIEDAISTDEAADDKYLSNGINAGADEVRLRSSTAITFDRAKLYRLTIRARKTAGLGDAYFGIYGLNAAGVAVNPLGVSAHWICAIAEDLPSDWAVYTGYFRGLSSAGDATVHDDPSDPACLKTGVVSFKLELWVNYSDQAGISDIDYVALDMMDED